MKRVLVAFSLIFVFVSSSFGATGTFLWWGSGGLADTYKDQVEATLATAGMRFESSDGDENLSSFISRTDPTSWVSPVILYWGAGEKAGLSRVGRYSMKQVSDMADSLRGIMTLADKQFDVIVLGPSYSANVELVSCFYNIGSLVLANPFQNTQESILGWVDQIKDIILPGLFASPLESCDSPYAQIADPLKVYNLLSKIRNRDLNTTHFSSLPTHPDYSSEFSDIWNVITYLNLQTETRDAIKTIIDEESPCWQGYSYFTCWNGKLRDVYLELVPQAHRVIQGESDLADLAGGCSIGNYNIFNLILLVLPSLIFLKK